MLFPSVVFLFYFLPATLLGYAILSFSRSLQNIFLLIASLLFYAWGEPIYVWLLISMIVVNYIFAIWIEKIRRKRYAKKVLFFVVLIDILILFIFKYAGFVVQNMQSFLSISDFNLPLPLGISFFTLQAVSYVVDIYRDDGDALKNPLDVGLYIAFFPQLIAGPIVRYHSIARQLKHRKTTFHKFSLGCCRFLAGLSKKILIANIMAIAVDLIYGWSDTGSISMLCAWTGAIMYVLQIYYDFSGYSDMAIGLGLMFGFVFEENFNYPYVAKSISEFWRRWHISLSAWIRDYIYIPLGGSRVKSNDTMVRNLFIVWMTTGIWHGANWTFLFWGIYNFVFIFIEKLLRIEEKNHRRQWFYHLYTLFVVCIGMVIFRSSDLSEAGVYLSNMFMIQSNGIWDARVLMLWKEYGLFIILGCVFATPICRRFQKQLLDKKWGKATLVLDSMYPIVMMILFLTCVTYIIKGSYNPFIYFNF